ncbi:MAG: hypothetical protein M3O25_04230, partial [Actinomycetota bacterium]|nr:hypothetical protein [Actinomycetota bacterium]
MEASVETQPQAQPPPEQQQPPTPPGGLAAAPVWVLAAVPLALIAVAIAAFALLGGPGLDERRGPPVEELAVERTVLRPG